jgi:hypothetical protein
MSTGLAPLIGGTEGGSGEATARRIVCVLVLVAAFALVPAARAPAKDEIRVLPDAPVTPEDLRIQPGNNTPAILSHPDEPRFVAIANRLDNPDFACALHLSGDGGRTFVGVNPVPELPSGAEKCYQPNVAFDAEGRLLFQFVGLSGPGNNPIGAFLTTSDDGGATFTKPIRILGPMNYMVRFVVDPTVGDRGRIHVVWLQTTLDAPLGGLPTPPNPIMAAHSDDGGRTFTRPIQVSDPDRDRVVAPVVALGPDGAVHVLYYDLGDDAIDYRGLEGPTWPGRWTLVMASSHDGGRSFEPGVVVDEGVVPPERVLLIYTMPPPAVAADGEGRVFAAWHDGRNGDWDVFLKRSDDGGRTWSDLLRLNDDRVGNGRHQNLPALSVAPNGRVDAIFYDRRNDPRNLFLDVYYTYSDDGGVTFAPNVRLTSQMSDSQAGTTYPIPSARGLKEFGSRISVASETDRALAAWTDTRNSAGSFQQDVFTTAVEFPSGGISGAAVAVTAATVALVAGALGGVVWRRRARHRHILPDLPGGSGG